MSKFKEELEEVIDSELLNHVNEVESKIQQDRNEALIKFDENSIELTTPQISFKDYESLVIACKNYVKQFQNVVITAETVKDLKKVRADLNKKITIIETARKETKKAILGPYETFEAQCKELVTIIENVNSKIDETIKLNEQNEVNAKLEKAKKYFQIKKMAMGMDYNDWTFEDFYVDTWKLSSIKVERIQAEIDANFSRISSDLELIKQQNEEVAAKALIIYKKEMNVSFAITGAKKAVEEEQKVRAQMLQKQVDQVSSQMSIDSILENEVEPIVKQNEVKEAAPIDNKIEKIFKVTFDNEAAFYAFKKWLKLADGIELEELNK